MKRSARRRCPSPPRGRPIRQCANGRWGPRDAVCSVLSMPSSPHRTGPLTARMFILRGLLAAAGLVALARLGATGLAAVVAWAAIVLAVGTEVLASVVFLLRRR